MIARRICSLGLVALVLSLTSCQGGSTSEITGKIQYKGTALTMGEILVRGENGVEVSGGIGQDGVYTIKNAPRGTLKVRIMCVDEKAYNAYFAALAGRGKGEPIGPDGKPAPKGKGKTYEIADFSKIPSKYADYDKSGLTIEVKDAKVTKDFNLD